MAPRNTQLATDLPLQGHLRFAELDGQNMHQQQRPTTSKRGSHNAIDELVRDARRFRSSTDYRDLLRFIRGFRDYSPFNATVVRIQSPGATYVAPGDRWLRDYDRVICPGARPLMILQPRGPVMFVYDVADTEPLNQHSRPLPKRITDPFAVTWHGDVEKVMTRTVENAARDGIRVTYTPSGADQAGCAMPARAQGTISFVTRRNPQRITASIQVRYDVVINSHLDAPAQYATLLHELAHIYCGHLGTPNQKWWPARNRLPHTQDEFEAESTAYLVASRLNSAVQFPPYLDQHLGENSEIPPISFDRVIKVSKELEDMGAKHLPIRKP